MNIDGRNFDTEKENFPTLEEKISALQKQISKEYKISILRVGELVKFSAGKSREELIAELKNETNETNLGENIDYDILAAKIAEISKLRESTRESIAGLNLELTKGEIELNNPQKFLVAKWFKKETLDRAQDPQNFQDQIVGLGIGTLESFATIGRFLFELPLGLFKSPNDGIKIANGKAEYDGVKKI